MVIIRPLPTMGNGNGIGWRPHRLKWQRNIIRWSGHQCLLPDEWHICPNLGNWCNAKPICTINPFLFLQFIYHFLPSTITIFPSNLFYRNFYQTFYRTFTKIFYEDFLPRGILSTRFFSLGVFQALAFFHKGFCKHLGFLSTGFPSTKILSEMHITSWICEILLNVEISVWKVFNCSFLFGND